jgi:hypothetical protein
MLANKESPLLTTVNRLGTITSHVQGTASYEKALAGLNLGIKNQTTARKPFELNAATEFSTPLKDGNLELEMGGDACEEEENVTFAS